ncbi:MAG: SPOR domain-containing protein [Phycisphaerales bacterium]|nr:SPOR domain-containing protein [Phycisphaerales bacterium]
MKREVSAAVVMVCGVTLSVAGCGGLPKPAQRQMTQAQMALTTGDYAGCERLVDPVIRAHPTDRAVAPAYYMRGQCRLQTSSRDAARQDLRQALRLASDDGLRGVVQAQLGNAAFEDNMYADAAAHYSQAVGHLPHSAPTDRVLYQYGVALQRTGQFEPGRRVFADIIKFFPNSQYANAARRKQAWSDPYFSVQCGAYSSQSGANAAAANLRARGLAALTVPELRDGGRYYVVRIGRFPKYEDAARLLARARSVAPDAFVVP